MTEAEHEKRFKQAAEERGCLTRKFVSPGHRGVPDQLVFCPGGRLLLVEMKTRGGRLGSWQMRELERYTRLGFTTAVAYSADDAVFALDNFLESHI
jgi:hypothetical protein